MTVPIEVVFGAALAPGERLHNVVLDSDGEPVFEPMRLSFPAQLERHLLRHDVPPGDYQIVVWTDGGARARADVHAPEGLEELPVLTLELKAE